MKEIFKLADKYDLQVVIQRCANFLLFESRFTSMQKLALAEMYNLEELKVNFIIKFIGILIKNLII